MYLICTGKMVQVDPSNTAFREEKWSGHEEETQAKRLERDFNV